MNLKHKFTLCVLITFYYGCFCQDTGCKTETQFGPDDPHTYNEAIDEDQGFGYLLYGDLYKITCCGVVSQWDFSAGDYDVLELQIWRPVDEDNKKFKLIGVNQDDVSRRDKKAGFQVFEVPKNGRISVEANDVIGWFSAVDSLISFNEGTDYNEIWKHKHANTRAVGEVENFGAGTAITARTFGIRPTVLPNSPPSFSNIAEAKVQANAEIGTKVAALKVTDENKDDINTLEVDLLTENPFFIFDKSSKELKVGANIEVASPGKTFTLTFRVTDRCGASVEATMDVVVDSVVDDVTTEDIEVVDDEDPATTSSFTFSSTTYYLEDDNTTSSVSEQSQTSSSSNAAIIALIVLLVVMLLIIVLGVVAYIYLKKRQAKLNAQKEAEIAERKHRLRNPGTKTPTTKTTTEQESKKPDAKKQANGAASKESASKADKTSGKPSEKKGAPKNTSAPAASNGHVKGSEPAKDEGKGKEPTAKSGENGPAKTVATQDKPKETGTTAADVKVDEKAKTAAPVDSVKQS